MTKMRIEKLKWKGVRMSDWGEVTVCRAVCRVMIGPTPIVWLLIWWIFTGKHEFDYAWNRSKINERR